MTSRTRYFAAAVLALSSVISVSAESDVRLIEAARTHDARAVRALLSQGVDVNAASPDGTTALHWSVYGDRGEVTDVLIRAGARVNAANELGMTPLLLACTNGNAVVVQRLLSAGADANLTLPSGESPLMTAARTGNVEIVKLLAAHGANLNARAARDQTALMWAVASEHPEVVRTLVELGADIKSRSEVRPQRVALRGAIDHRQDYTPMEQLGGYTALLFAARAGNLDSARVLLDAGADVNDEAPNGTSALVVAAHSGQGQLAAFLLDKGADANAAAAGYTALHAAVLRGDLALVKALLAHGADPNATLTNGTRSRYFSSDYAFNASFVGATSYWLAARYAEVEMMTILAAAGADPRRPAADFSSPLLAVLAGGSSFGSSDRRERYLTPTELAAQSPEKEQQLTLQAATLAVTLGADVNARTKKGDTALHLAASRWDARLVQFLIEHGGDVNASNDDGETPLHNAAYLAKRDVITLLVDHGANLAASNKKGETPLRKTAIRVRAVAVGVFVTDDELDTTAALLRQLGATE